jgi:hypothetical protein
MNSWTWECSLVTIGIERASAVVGAISDDAMRMAQHVTTILNTVSLTRAVQEGYAMCCRDHGLPVPDMPDPAAQFGLR